MKTKFLLLSLTGLLVSFSMFGATITSKADGNWNTTGTWDIGMVPGADDDVVINNTVTINATGLSCNNLTINASKELKFNANSTSNIFTVNGNFTISGTFTQTNNQGWPVNVHGDFIIQAGGKYTTHSQGNLAAVITMKGAGKKIQINGTVASTDNRFSRLVIDLPLATDVISLETDISFVNHQDATLLNINKGIIDAKGHNLSFTPKGNITIGANGGFAGPLTPGCLYTVDNLPSILLTDGGSGSALKVTGTLCIKNFTNNNKDNWKFPDNAAAVLYVFGTFDKQRYSNNDSNILNNTGTWYWGPDSWYKSGGTDTNEPNGTYAATGSATRTPNPLYVVPAIIQEALENCSPNCPTPTFTQPSTTAQNVCIGGTMPTLTLGTVAKYTAIQWYYVASTATEATGGTSLGSDNGAQTATLSISTAVASAYKYYAVITNSCDGKTETSITTSLSGIVSVLDLPTITAPVTVAGTQGYTAATITYAGSTSSPTQYQITWDSGITSDASYKTLGASGSAIALQAAPANAGTFTGTILVKNVAGCASSTPVAVTATLADKSTIDEDAGKTCNAVQTLYMLLNNYSGRYVYEKTSSNLVLFSDAVYYTSYRTGQSATYPTIAATPESYWILSATPDTDNFGTWINYSTGRYMTMDATTAADTEGRRVITTTATNGNNSSWKFYGANTNNGGTYFMNANTALDNKNPNYVNGERSNGNGSYTEANRELRVGGDYNGNGRGTKGFYIRSIANPYDLSIEYVKVSKRTALQDEDTFIATATIKNAGTADIASGKAIKVKFAFNGQFYYATLTTGLQAGKTATVQATIDPINLTAGAPVTVTVNSDNNIMFESSCSNNTMNSANVQVVAEEPEDCTAAGVTPLSDKGICTGGSATFTADATGTGLTYQWFSVVSGVEQIISGETSASYTTSTAGTYKVYIQAECGDEVSSSATLTQSTATSITTQPTSATICEGDADHTFSVTAQGAGLTYQWQELVEEIYQDIDGEESATFSTATAGTYKVVVNGTCGDGSGIESNAVTLTVNAITVITDQPVGGELCDGSTKTLSVTATGTNLTYQWYKDEAPISDAENAIFIASEEGTYKVTIEGACNNETSNDAVLTVTTPAEITTQPLPVNKSICSPNTWTYSIEATGDNLTYQWYNGTTEIEGANSDSYEASESGAYKVVVSGCNDITSETATLTVGTPTAITTQLADGTVCEDPVTLTVVAEGTDLHYQWYRNNELQENAADEASYQTTLPGTYFVYVSGDVCQDGVMSDNAVLSDASTIIVTEPASACTDGTSHTFSTVAEGENLTYQWYKNDIAISGETNSTLTTTEIGMYKVIIYGDCGNAESQEASLSPCTGYNDVVTSKAIAYSSNGVLYIQGLAAGEEYAVYNTAGQAIVSGKAGSSTVELSLKKGVYLVKLQGKIVKVF